MARLTYDEIKRLERRPELVPKPEASGAPEVQARLVQEVEGGYTQAGQLGPGRHRTGDRYRGDRGERTTSMVVGQTIGIPKITVVPTDDTGRGSSRSRWTSADFTPQPISDELWSAVFADRRGAVDWTGSGRSGDRGPAEDYVVSGLVDFDDVAYEENADLLYDLAGQVVAHLRGYLEDEEDSNACSESTGKDDCAARPQRRCSRITGKRRAGTKRR